MRGRKRKLSKYEEPPSLPLRQPNPPGMKEVHGQRYVERLVRKALQNKKVLPFQLSDLHAKIDKDRVKVTGKGFRPALNTETVLQAEDGPQMVVDLNGDIVMFYCPRYITEALSQSLLQSITDIVRESPPVPDKPTGDKRTRNNTLTSKQTHPKNIESLGDLAPSAYYLATAWYGTGQEQRTNPCVSKDMKKLLQPTSKHKFQVYLDCTRLINHQIKHLVDMIHPKLGHTLRNLAYKVQDLDSDCSRVLAESWNSAYMTQAIAFNRKTALHRDSKGFRNNFEVLYLLGNFQGGHLKLQDLSLRVEWGPRDLCIFDGYTFAHEATDWTGSERVCNISFCRASTFKGLQASLLVDRPNIKDVSTILRRCA